MQKVFGYARVSTARQHEDRQVESLREYGVDSRNIIVDRESGKDFNRAGYSALKENLLRPGDTLVVKELDRLGRNKAKIKEELEWCRAEGVRVRILNEGQDWVLDMVSNILIEVMASMAEEERAEIHRRQEEGIAVAKEKGVAFGRPSVARPYNFDQIMGLVDSGRLKAVEAMRELNMKKTTYYKLRRAYRSGC